MLYFCCLFSERKDRHYNTSIPPLQCKKRMITEIFNALLRIFSPSLIFQISHSQAIISSYNISLVSPLSLSLSLSHFSHAISCNVLLQYPFRQWQVTNVNKSSCKCFSDTVAVAVAGKGNTFNNSSIELHQVVNHFPIATRLDQWRWIPSEYLFPNQ